MVGQSSVSASLKRIKELAWLSAKVMHHLADGPAAIAIRGVELSFTQAADRGAKAFREQAQSFNMRGANAGHAGGGRTKTPDGIAKVFMIGLIGHAKNVNTP